MQHGQWPWPAEVAASPRRATLAAPGVDVLPSAGTQMSDSKSCFKAAKLFSVCAFREDTTIPAHRAPEAAQSKPW